MAGNGRRAVGADGRWRPVMQAGAPAAGAAGAPLIAAARRFWETAAAATAVAEVVNCAYNWLSFRARPFYLAVAAVS